MSGGRGERGKFLWGGVLAVCAVGFLAIIFGGVLRNDFHPSLTVYCAHDAIYAEKILRRFQEQTGIHVNARFDTEATKSLGLTELIAREREHPRCDVFWNNEQLGTVWLADQGLLQPYKGVGYAHIPSQFKDPQGLWTGFAARMRVWIVNTNRVKASVGEPDLRQAIDRLIQSPDLSRLAIAKPLYGTTRTHYTVLWDALGPEGVQDWRRDWRRRGVVEVNGNAMVKDLVASGTCDAGLTDTDDFFAAKDSGNPVSMIPVTVEAGSPRAPKTIVIPNTVAIIKGARHAETARRLVDFLLSAETELALATSDSRQIPLGPVESALVPEEVKHLVAWAGDPYPLDHLAEASEACLAWLRAEYLR